MQPVIKKGKVIIITFYYPVGHSISSKINTAASVGSGLPFQRQGIVILAVYDGSNQRRDCNAVPEQIRSTGSLSNCSVIGF